MTYNVLCKKKRQLDALIHRCAYQMDLLIRGRANLPFFCENSQNKLERESRERGEFFTPYSVINAKRAFQVHAGECFPAQKNFCNA